MEVAIGAMASAIITAGTLYAAVIRGQLTKKDHEEICSGKQQLVFTKLDTIKEQVDKMDKKLDRLLWDNGNKESSRGKSA